MTIDPANPSPAETRPALLRIIIILDYWIRFVNARAVPALAERLGADHARKSRILSAISLACVSTAKCPVSRKRTTAEGISRLNAAAPGGRKNGSFLPHTARSGGLCARKYSWNDG